MPWIPFRARATGQWEGSADRGPAWLPMGGELTIGGQVVLSHPQVLSTQCVSLPTWVCLASGTPAAPGSCWSRPVNSPPSRPGRGKSVFPRCWAAWPLLVGELGTGVQAPRSPASLCHSVGAASCCLEGWYVTWAWWNHLWLPPSGPADHTCSQASDQPSCPHLLGHELRTSVPLFSASPPYLQLAPYCPAPLWGVTMG